MTKPTPEQVALAEKIGKNCLSIGEYLEQTGRYKHWVKEVEIDVQKAAQLIAEYMQQKDERIAELVECIENMWAMAHCYHDMPSRSIKENKRRFNNIKWCADKSLPQPPKENS